MGSVETLSELGAVKTFLGDLRGRDVLDFGCAAHEIAEYAVSAGARYVGLSPADVSGCGPAEVRTIDLDRWSGHDLGVFDVAVAVRVAHYVANLARLLETLHHHVAGGGRLVLSVDHPIATGGTDYLRPGLRESPQWMGRRGRHRTFSDYVQELRYCGFQVLEVAEGTAGDQAQVPQWMVFRCVRTP